MNRSQKRLDWIDYGKAICMLLVILFHVWAYYVKEGSHVLNVLRPTRLFVFFFISGYLINIEKFNYKKTIKSIIKKLLFPYFIFTSIIWIPKALAHGDTLNLRAMAYDILGGYASWFVAALAVSKFTLSTILHFTKSLKVIWGICVGLFFVGLLMTQHINANIPWFIHYGLISLIYLIGGITYRKYESKINLKIKYQTIIASLLYFSLTILDYLVFDYSTYLFTLGYGEVTFIGVSSFMVLSILGIWMLTSIVKLLPSNIKWLSYIGTNSLTYYYLNTGLITVLCIIFKKAGLLANSTNVWSVLMFTMVVIILTVISHLINRYAPWMVGRFSLTKKILTR